MTVSSSKTMQAWVVSQPGPIETGPLRYVEKPVPAPAPGELLVQVLACAVCRTDLHVSEGDLPVHREHVTPGHMVVGPVAALGDRVTGYAVGDRVGVAWLRHTDGTCAYCRRGNENLCPDSLYTGWDADGGYAEYTTVPAAFAYRLPADVADVELAPLLRGDHRLPGAAARIAAGARQARIVRIRRQRPPGRPGGAGARSLQDLKAGLFDGAAVFVNDRDTAQ